MDQSFTNDFQPDQVRRPPVESVTPDHHTPDCFSTGKDPECGGDHGDE